jgi:hypothetical protein
MESQHLERQGSLRPAAITRVSYHCATMTGQNLVDVPPRAALRAAVDAT